MTQWRANILNELYAGASGRADGFRYYKNPLSLCIARTNQHFTWMQPRQVLPSEVIRPTAEQRRAMDEVVDALDSKDDTDETPLKHAIRQLYLALICQTVGGVPFKSPVLSFCAMLSRKAQGKGVGLWEEPGNFNSHLSALTWTTQLVLFDCACFYEQEDEDQIPVFISTILAALPVPGWEGGHCKAPGAVVLGWADSRVSRAGVTDIACVATHRVRISASTLALSWRLKDDLEMEDFGGSWLTHRCNTEFVEGANRALFQRIQSSANLRAMFLTKANDGSMALSTKAMAVYEATAQEFLKSVLVLKHVPPGRPLREPELLGLQGQHPVLAKGDWGSAVRLHRIRDTATTDVPLPADA
ncbi:hypothetical protein V502_00258 [Pseudogymnoascus sp. VKM F-4520 (FW-2644)]|nr:hypothetical protein V502_00258 [Pseudogymnoascus sp. VKM F-4520 (FW-2644)]